MPMLTHYIDFMVIADEETSVPQVMGALYEKLHLALVENKAGNIGVSFPQYRMTAKWIGSVLRLHGAEADLEAFMASDWLKGVRDYVHISDIDAVPEGTIYRVVYRKQFKTNVDRLRRRRMKRKGVTMEDAIKTIPDTVARSPDLPYLWMRSLSTQQRFCLFIGMSPPRKTPVPGRFSCYGFSNEATIPWF